MYHNNMWFVRGGDLMGHKVGLVIEGGGMKCAYSAGVLDRFLDDGIDFQYVVGVSAGAANGASFVAKQRNRNNRFYTKHCKEKGYFGLGTYIKTGDLFGLDYIYGTLSNSTGDDALDYDTMIKNPTEFEIVVTNATTGEAEYYSKTDMPRDDYELIKASSSLPGACHAREINGNYYYDGGVRDSIPVERALEKGCDRIVVILSKPRDFVMKKQSFKGLYTMLCHRFPKIVELLDHRHTEYMKQYNEVFELEKEGKAFVFCPDGSLSTGTYKMNIKSNQKMYDSGVIDYDNSVDELEKFLA